MQKLGKMLLLFIYDLHTQFSRSFALERRLLTIIVVFHRLSDPSQYQSIVDAEWNIIYDKLDKCVKSGAKIVLSRLAIGDLATQVMIPFFWLTSCENARGKDMSVSVLHMGFLKPSAKGPLY